MNTDNSIENNEEEFERISKSLGIDSAPLSEGDREILQMLIKNTKKLAGVYESIEEIEIIEGIEPGNDISGI